MLNYSLIKHPSLLQDKKKIKEKGSQCTSSNLNQNRQIYLSSRKLLENFLCNSSWCNSSNGLSCWRSTPTLQLEIGVHKLGPDKSASPKNEANNVCYDFLKKLPGLIWHHTSCHKLHLHEMAYKLPTFHCNPDNPMILLLNLSIPETTKKVLTESNVDHIYTHFSSINYIIWNSNNSVNL